DSACPHPQPPRKTDKATIVEATINYIKNLQDKIHKMEMLKVEREHAIALATAATATAAASADTALQAPPPSEEENEEHDSVVAAATREMALADMVHAWEQQQEAAATGGSHGGHAVPPPPPAASLQTWTGPNMTASLTGDDGFITLSLPHQGGQKNLVAGAVSVLERHHIDVVTATVSASEQGDNLISLHCHLSPGSSSSQNLTPLDKFKLAMSELMLWVISV
ncbi:Os04g0429300, partial [Oryza sativa Japonica Group]